MIEAKRRIDWDNADTVAKEWWESLESLNKDQPLLVCKLAKELEKRGVSINDFFEVWLHSHLHDLEANLDHLDRLIQDQRAIGKVEGFKNRESLDQKNLTSHQVLSEKLIYRPSGKTIH